MVRAMGKNSPLLRDHLTQVISSAGLSLAKPICPNKSANFTYKRCVGSRKFSSTIGCWCLLRSCGRCRRVYLRVSSYTFGYICFGYRVPSGYFLYLVRFLVSLGRWWSTVHSRGALVFSVYLQVELLLQQHLYQQHFE